MKKLLALAVVVAAVWFWLQSGKYDFGTVLASTDKELVIRKGEFTMEMTKLDPVSLDLRVFATMDTRGKFGIDDADIAPLYLLADSAARNAEIFRKYLCEEKSADQAAYIRLLTPSRSLAQKVEGIELEGDARRCFAVTGTPLYIDRIVYQGKDRTDPFTNISSSVPIQPRRMLRLSDIREIPCQ